jgi:hypothetical protein
MQTAKQLNSRYPFVVIIEEPGRIVIYGRYETYHAAYKKSDEAFLYGGVLDKLIDLGCVWSPIYCFDHHMIFGIKHRLRVISPIGDLRTMVLELYPGASLEEYLIMRKNYSWAIDPRSNGERFVCCN